MFSNTVSIVLFSYSFLITILILPQTQESVMTYKNRLKLLSLSILPIIVSTFTVYCLENTCYHYARLNALIIMFWCVFVVYIYLFKKLI